MKVFVNGSPLTLADDDIAFFRSKGGFKGCNLRARIPAAEAEERIFQARPGADDILIRDDDAIELRESAEFFLVPRGIMGG